jgi:hypothetical protein
LLVIYKLFDHVIIRVIQASEPPLWLKTAKITVLSQNPHKTLTFPLTFSTFNPNMAPLVAPSLGIASYGGFLNAVEKCQSPTEAFNSGERQKINCNGELALPFCFFGRNSIQRGIKK